MRLFKKSGINVFWKRNAPERFECFTGDAFSKKTASRRVPYNLLKIIKKIISVRLRFDLSHHWYPLSHGLYPTVGQQTVSISTCRWIWNDRNEIRTCEPMIKRHVYVPCSHIWPQSLSNGIQSLWGLWIYIKFTKIEMR